MLDCKTIVSLDDAAYLVAWAHSFMLFIQVTSASVVVLKKVPTSTGPCCIPSTVSCHSYGLASHQVLHDLALSCTISHKK